MRVRCRLENERCFMRRIQPFCLAIAFLGVFAAAGDTGLPPRPNSSDYPVHQDTKSSTIAAALVAPEQVKKIFSGDFNRKYVVVEVAVYPRDGASTDVDSFDFALKLGTGEVIHPARLEEIGKVWHEKGSPLPGHPVSITSETGVVYGSSSGPNGGTHGWGTYTGVGVEAGGSGQQPAPPPPPSSPSDQNALDAKIRAKALPQGQTSRAVAGYLYFRVASKGLSGSINLECVKDGGFLSMPLPFK
jgi:hypothetical protein